MRGEEVLTAAGTREPGIGQKGGGGDSRRHEETTAGLAGGVPEGAPAPAGTVIWENTKMTSLTRLRTATWAVALSMLGACVSYPPPIQQSEGHIARDKSSGAIKDAPPPVTTQAYVPEPKPKAKVPTYSVVVHEVPVKELLLALARDTKENIDIHPGLQGLVSLNAIDEPLTSILDRVARQVDMRYRVEGRTIIVSPDTPYMKTYQVNYVNMSRDTTSTVAVSGQISGGAPGAGTGTAGGQGTSTSGGTGGQAGASTTSVNSSAKNNFWDVMRENIQAILRSTSKLSQSADEKQARAEAQRAAREDRLAAAEAVSRAGANAASLFNTVFGPDGKGDLSDVAINPVTGTIVVLATDKQHALIQEFLTGVSNASHRQVVIEATIVEVTLSNGYQAGVDWARLFKAAGDGFSIRQNLSSVPGADAALIAAYSNNPTGATVSATLRLLETYGDTKVLSSPKLMALNNQTALLKVVDNVVYFTFEREVSEGNVNQARRETITTTVNTVAVGVSMTVTPQVNENGVVTLIVRPTISGVLREVEDPNPALKFDSSGNPLPTPVVNRIPVVTVREMESVLQLSSGQVAILGGLMQDNVSKKKKGVPGLSRVQGVGDVFSQRDELTTKSELVIFLKPTVVTNPSLDSDELRPFRRYLPESERISSK